MKPVVAIIGLGVMGRRMLANMHKIGGFEFAGGWDPSVDACTDARAIIPDFNITDNPEILISDSRVDLVYIACPPANHKQYASAAIAAGKAIYCEKPLGIDIDESRLLVEEVEAVGTKHCVNFSLATAVAVEFIDQGLKDGSIGDVQGVNIDLHFNKWPRDWQVPAAWLSERAEGGFVRETFSHYAYLSQRLFGPVKIKKAYTCYPNDDTSAEISSIAALECSHIPISFVGGVGGINSSKADKIEFTIWGSNSVYQLYDWNRIRTHSGSGWTEQLTDLGDLREIGYERALSNVKKFMRGEPHVMPSFRDALCVQETVEEILNAK
jgi:1,5-anhydro-D-fructose reductase (1,5-anhydro-D-mannitol-forming)